MEQEREFDQGLTDLESALKDLAPGPARLDIAHTMFLAGQQSMHCRLRRQALRPLFDRLPGTAVHYTECLAGDAWPAAYCLHPAGAAFAARRDAAAHQQRGSVSIGGRSTVRLANQLASSRTTAVVRGPRWRVASSRVAAPRFEQHVGTASSRDASFRVDPYQHRSLQ